MFSATQPFRTQVQWCSADLSAAHSQGDQPSIKGLAFLNDVVLIQQLIQREFILVKDLLRVASGTTLTWSALLPPRTSAGRSEGLQLAQILPL